MFEPVNGVVIYGEFQYLKEEDQLRDDFNVMKGQDRLLDISFKERKQSKPKCFLLQFMPLFLHSRHSTIF